MNRAIDLRMAPEYRRCAIYVAVGAVVVVGLLIESKLDGWNPRSWESVGIGIGVVTSGAGGLLVITHRYRFRIDVDGIWRRRLIRWNLWPWEAFEDGRIRHESPGDHFSFPGKPSWLTLSPVFLGEADRTVFESAVARFRKPPPTPELPADVTIYTGYRSGLELSAEGVRLFENSHDAGELVKWAEITKMDVVRKTHDRLDFESLELHLSGRDIPITLAKHSGRPGWNGATAEVIAHFIQRNLGDARIQVTALRGSPRDTAEIDRRLALLEKDDQKNRQMYRACWYAFVFGFLAFTVMGFEPWNRPNPLNWGQKDIIRLGLALGISVILMGMNAPMCFGVCYMIRRDIRRKRDELARLKMEFPPVNGGQVVGV